jgi:hypothetical protein
MFEKEIILRGSLKEQLAHGDSSSVARPENCRPMQVMGNAENLGQTKRGAFSGDLLAGRKIVP